MERIEEEDSAEVGDISTGLQRRRHGWSERCSPRDEYHEMTGDAFLGLLWAA